MRDQCLSSCFRSTSLTLGCTCCYVDTSGLLALFCTYHPHNARVRSCWDITSTRRERAEDHIDWISWNARCDGARWRMILLLILVPDSSVNDTPALLDITDLLRGAVVVDIADPASR